METMMKPVVVLMLYQKNTICCCIFDGGLDTTNQGRQIKIWHTYI